MQWRRCLFCDGKKPASISRCGDGCTVCHSSVHFLPYIAVKRIFGFLVSLGLLGGSAALAQTSVTISATATRTAQAPARTTTTQSSTMANPAGMAKSSTSTKSQTTMSKSSTTAAGTARSSPRPAPKQRPTARPTCAAKPIKTPNRRSRRRSNSPSCALQEAPASIGRSFLHDTLGCHNAWKLFSAPEGTG